MKRQFPIALEGMIIIIPLLLLTIVVYMFSELLMLILAILTAFCIFFFRNPNRKVPEIQGVIVAPADGTIKSVERTHEKDYIGNEAVKISIFLSIFNVHINRSPVEGTVELVKRVSGRFLPAFKKEASDKNARNLIGLNTRWGKVLVVQITGIIARRIVCWVREGDYLSTGERFGLIRFGSCTEVFLPPNVEITVKTGDKVKGGQTIIGRFN